MEYSLLLLMLCVVPLAVADWGDLINSVRGRQLLAKEHAMAHAQGMPSADSSSLATIHNFMHQDKVKVNQEQKVDDLNKVWRYHHDFVTPWHFMQHVAGHRAINNYHNVHQNQWPKQQTFMEAVQQWLNKQEEKTKFQNYQKLDDFHKELHKRTDEVMKWKAFMKIQEQKEEERKKFEQFQKLQKFHEEQHKRIANMMQWSALIKLHTQKEKEYQFGLLMKHYEEHQMRYVFETVFGLVKFCKSKETINSMHKYLAPEGAKPDNGTNSLFDFGAELESDWPNPWNGVLPKPRSTAEAKKMFFKGLVNTLCASAKTYVKHVKAMAAQINGIGDITEQYGMDGSLTGNGGNQNQNGGNGNQNSGNGNQNGGTGNQNGGSGNQNGGNGNSLSERGYKEGNKETGQTMNFY